MGKVTLTPDSSPTGCTGWGSEPRDYLTWAPHLDPATLFLAQLDGEELHALLRDSQSAVEDAARAFM